jgi:DNA sulfur modification protein DndD
MKFKSIELTNFRQFANTSKITFSEETEKNVTVIIANNGAGKTTMLQAFKWCLYDEVDFDIEEDLFNKANFNITPIKQFIEVKVTLEIEKDGDLYKLTRTKNFVKVTSSKADTKPSSVVAFVRKRDVGNFVMCSVYDIFNIIPKELSTYFLFDGERMKNLSENSVEGKKDLKAAVTSILGIDILHNSITDLKSVIRLFKDQKQGEDKQLMDKLNKMVQFRDNLIDVKSKENEKWRKQLHDNSKRIEKIDEYLISSILVAEKAKQREFIEGEIKSNTIKSEQLLTQYYQYYSENSYVCYAKNLFQKGLEIIDRMKIDDKAIIGIDSKAINLILSRGFCICGTEIRSDSNERNQLENLLNFVPPKSLSTLLAYFKDNTRRFEEDSIEVADKLKQKYIEYSDCLQKIVNYENSLNQINAEIANNDVLEITDSQKVRLDLKNSNATLSIKIGENNKSITDAQNELEKIEKKRAEIAVNNEYNKRIDKKIMLSNDVLDRLEKEVKTYESSLRERLKEKVNEIGNKIFTHKRNIAVDLNYEFKFLTSSGIVALSEGEKVMASFASVSAIIELAKLSNIILRVEKYPLVMDAPFAKLDDTHRKNVANFIPQIAEQVILFTIDSQWNGPVQQAMMPYVGKKYIINKISDEYSEVEEKNES